MVTLTNAIRMSDSAPFNIALEEGLRHVVSRNLASGIPAGFFSTYVNGRCIVLGRNQDARAEVSGAALQSGTLPVYRRTSGGGAVYHDGGNLNWSFVVGGSLSDRKALLALIVGALIKLGIPAEPGERGEILAGGRKIGGTAGAAGNGTLLFHGTLLVKADLGALRAALAAHGSGYRSDAVRSVPSTLANVSEFKPEIDVRSLAGMLESEAGRAAPVDWESLLDPHAIRRMAGRFSGDAWILDRMPANAIDEYPGSRIPARDRPMKGIA